MGEFSKGSEWYSVFQPVLGMGDNEFRQASNGDDLKWY